MSHEKIIIARGPPAADALHGGSGILRVAGKSQEHTEFAKKRGTQALQKANQKKRLFMEETM